MWQKIQIPRWLYFCFPRIKFRSSDTAILLTFDDGPHPNSTPEILDILDRNGWKAWFFMLGCQAEKHPELVQLIRQKGHGIGNHGFGHLNGWKISSQVFWENEKRGRSVLRSRSFRPPYGHMSPRSYLNAPKEISIVLWDLMTYDFDPSMSSIHRARIFQRMRKDSIIVLHDRPECLQQTLRDLDSIANMAAEKGWKIRDTAGEEP
jgi:peptidoglycan/xylan/chitin deacetylase (PgdA/CDA1 family)